MADTAIPHSTGLSAALLTYLAQTRSSNLNQESPRNTTALQREAKQLGHAPAAVEEGDAEGAETAKLGVALLVVAQRAHQLLHRDGLLVRVLILLRR